MSEISWRQDGVDPAWFIAEGIGSVRSTVSYGRSEGWWFLPAWLPDTEENDIGPFRTKAPKEAERLAAAQDQIARSKLRLSSSADAGTSFTLVSSSWSAS